MPSPEADFRMELFRSSVSAAGVIGLFSAVIACNHSSSMAQGFFQPSVQSKLDPELLRRLEELTSLGQMDQMLSVLIRTVPEINLDQENLLQSRGVIINSKLGKILSVTLPAKSIQAVAAMEFVLHIELARKFKKRGDP